MSKIIKLTESDLTNLVKKVLAEEQTTNYMLFSNLEQIKRQCEILLEMDPNMIDEIIQDGHDWADDHVSEAKNNMDQVFDFLMNETKKQEEYVDFEDMNVLEGWPRRKENSKFTPPLIQTVTESEYVKVICQVLMVKNIVQGHIVNKI
jgi:hypothetical protein